MMRKNRGFTLVEMAVTLAILTVLVAVGIPMISGWIDSAAEKRCVAEMGMLRSDYAAHVVYGEFDIDDETRAKMLESAANEALGKSASNKQYKDFQGNDCTVFFSEDNTAINAIVCARHGALGMDEKVPPIEVIDYVGKTQKALYNKDNKFTIVASGVDSNAPESIPSNPTTYAGKVRKQLEDDGIDFAGMGAVTWRISPNVVAVQTSLDNCTLYWSGADITESRDPVYAMAYDYANKKYRVGTMTVIRKNTTYNILNVFTAAEGSTGYDTYEEARAAYAQFYGTAVRPEK